MSPSEQVPSLASSASSVPKTEQLQLFVTNKQIVFARTECGVVIRAGKTETKSQPNEHLLRESSRTHSEKYENVRTQHSENPDDPLRESAHIERIPRMYSENPKNAPRES